jgi:hypothetical protein
MRVWAREGPFGTELAEVTHEAGTLAAMGIAIGTAPVPYRLDYHLATVEGYVTARLLVRARGSGWRRSLDLQRAASGAWSCTAEAEGGLDLSAPGGDLAEVAGGLDCDLAFSPLTNSMPVLRHRLDEGGGPVEFLMAWVSVPDLAVRPSRQRYTFVRREDGLRIVRFESLDSAFVAEVGFDDDGLVLDYPGIARRVA